MKSLIAILTIFTLAPAVLRAEARDFLITESGAVGDGKTLNTAAIQRAIDKAAASEGGGRVVAPAGVFRSGSIFLKEGVALWLDKDAVLLGSTDIADYPKRDTRIEGHVESWPMALVNAQNMKHVRIGGPGKIDGNGMPFWTEFWRRRRKDPKVTNLAVERPRLIFIDTCADVRVSDVVLRNSGFWHLHLYRCRDVVIDGLDISSTEATSTGATPRLRAPSTDGIDIDSSQNVTVRRCRFAVDDDCIALKGSKGPLADRDASSPPVENVLVEKCVFVAGAGVVTFGSEATVVRGVIVRDCDVNGRMSVVRLKLRPDTPQTYENILYENIRLGANGGAVISARPWLQFFDLQGQKPPMSVVRNLTVRNVSGAFGSFGTLGANAGAGELAGETAGKYTIDGVVFENLDLRLGQPRLSAGPMVRNLQMRNVKINGEEYKK